MQEIFIYYKKKKKMHIDFVKVGENFNTHHTDYFFIFNLYIFMFNRFIKIKKKNYHRENNPHLLD